MHPQIKEPTTRNARNTFKALEGAALEIFYKNGYHGTTIADITNRAGIAAGTFYLYFPSKLVLYQHILMSLSHDIRKEISSKVSEKKTRYEKERVGIKTFINYALKRPEMYNIIWESLYIDRELFRDYYADFAKRYKRGLEQATTTGEIRPLDTEVVSYILMGITNFIGLKIVMDLGEGNDDVDAIVDVVMEILEKGLFRKRQDSSGQ